MNNAKAFASVKKIQAGLNQLAGPQKAVLQKLLGQAAVAQASIGIRMSQTPYGEPFAALTSRVGKPLRRTGNNIQRSWTAGQETPTTFVFGSRFKWLKTHQYGAVIKPKRAKYLRFRMEATGNALLRRLEVTIPRRQMIPEKDTGGLGSRWTNAFKRTAKGYLEKLFLSKAA